MTVTQDFLSEDGDNFEELTEYPAAFGITLTPQITAIGCGVVGILGGAYILINMILPLQTSFQELQSSQGEKINQLQQLKAGATQAKINSVKGEIEQQKNLKDRVFSLFASEKNLDTLLLDLNAVVASNKADLISYRPEGDDKGTVINDGSLGKLVDGKVKSKIISVEIKGTFSQTETILRNIEKLQPLLIVQDLNSELEEGRKGKMLVNENKFLPEAQVKLKTKFRLAAILPLTEEEIAALAPPKEEAPPGSK